MALKKQIHKQAALLTRTRIAATTLILGLVLIAASSCNKETPVQQTGSPQQANAASNQTANNQKSQSTAEKNLQMASTQPFAPGVLETEIQGVDGQSFHLADYKGKVIVLDLWATWCGPCRIEIPHLAQLKSQYAGKDVEIIGLTNEDPTTDAEKVRDFAREMKINYKLGWATQTLWSSLGRAQSIPQTFVIGRDGRPVRFFAGFTPQSLPDGASNHVATPARVQKAIEQALGAGTSGD